MVTEFQEYLVKSNLSQTTIKAYVVAVKYYLKNYENVSANNLLAYKGYLLEHFKPQTVNLRIQAVNKYLEFLESASLKMKFVRVQQKDFLENVISDADYDALMAEYGTFIKPRIISDKNPDGCFIVHNSDAAARAQSAEIGDKKDASAPIVIENKNKKTK